MDIAPIDDHHPTAAADVPLHRINKQLPLRVLSEADWTHWTTKGYVIVPQVVPRDYVERLVALLYEFDEKDPGDPSTWYAPQRRDHKMLELNNTGMVEIYNHQYLWDNRMEPRIYDTFVDIWDREDLWVTIDRANVNPPRKEMGSPDGFIHWDVDTSLDPLPVGVQGVLSLLPQDRDTGGFQCVPYLFEHFDDWVESQPADRNPKHPDLTGLEVVNVEYRDVHDFLLLEAVLGEFRKLLGEIASVPCAGQVVLHRQQFHVAVCIFEVEACAQVMFADGGVSGGYNNCNDGSADNE